MEDYEDPITRSNLIAKLEQIPSVLDVTPNVFNSKICLDSFIGLITSHLCVDKLITKAPDSSEEYNVESNYWEIREVLICLFS